MPYINHVAVPVNDVDQAIAFYQDWFDARVVPSPRFPVPVAWLLLGKVQVHLVQHADQPSRAYHFSVAFERRGQFEALYWRADREGRFDRETFRHHLYELPGGAVQMYVRDVSGNIIECVYPYLSELSREIADVRRLWADSNEQSEWNNSSSLFMPEQAGLALEPAAPRSGS
jgi:catechol 2,3-dioxygenase-like lactoylglutathione lyase family enzyme